MPHSCAFFLAQGWETSIPRAHRVGGGSDPASYPIACLNGRSLVAGYGLAGFYGLGGGYGVETHDSRMEMSRWNMHASGELVNNAEKPFHTLAEITALESGDGLRRIGAWPRRSIRSIGDAGDDAVIKPCLLE